MKKMITPLLALSSTVQSAELPKIKWGGFIDTYYAYDSNNPKDHEREFTTQPVRHNEFNVNLAYLDAVIKEEKTRGRLALQFGNSVSKNYLSDPKNGASTQNQDARFLQEAYVGKKLGDRTWIDAGIFFGNIGAESWISKENWTYTRALNLDYVPYYSAGVRLEHQIDHTQSFQFQILNGWQVVTENNQGKAIGMQYKKAFSDILNFTYNNFFGDEKVVPNPETGKYNSRFRGYHNFILQWLATERWQFLGALDFGHQSQQNNDGIDGWMASTLTIRRVINPEQSLAWRAEYYNDAHEANVSTETPHGFQVIASSINFDQNLDANALWRTEIRGFRSEDRIYPSGVKSKNRWDGIFTTSLSLWF